MQLRTIAITACLAVAQLVVAGLARAQYQVTNLVSNQEKTASTTDPLLVNAWGLTHGTGSPWWISDENSGWSTLYDKNGTKVPLNVLIPTAGGLHIRHAGRHHQRLGAFGESHRRHGCRHHPGRVLHGFDDLHQSIR
jgi:hypothetical protein